MSQEPNIVLNLKNSSIQYPVIRNIKNISKDLSPEFEIKDIDDNNMPPLKNDDIYSFFKPDEESTESTMYEDLSLSSSKNHSSFERTQKKNESNKVGGYSDGNNVSFETTILLRETNEDNNGRPLVPSRIENNQSRTYGDFDRTKTNTLPYSDSLLNTSIKDHLHKISLKKRERLKDRLLKENSSQRLIQQFSEGDHTPKHSQISDESSTFELCDGKDDNIRDLPIDSEKLPWANFSTKDEYALVKWKRLYSNSVRRIRTSNLGGNALRKKAREEIKQLKIERMNLFCF